MSRKINKRRDNYISAIRAMYGSEKHTFTRAELRAVSAANGWKWIPNWITHDQDRRVKRGTFSIPEVTNIVIASVEDSEPVASEVDASTPEVVEV